MSKYVIGRAVKAFKKGSKEKSASAAVFERLALLAFCFASYRAFLPVSSNVACAFNAFLYWTLIASFLTAIWHFLFYGDYKPNKGLCAILPAVLCALIFPLLGYANADLAFVGAACAIFIYAVSTMFRERAEIAFFVSVLILISCVASFYAFREFAAVKINFVEEGKSFTDYKISPHIGALGFGSSGALACFLCAMLPYPLAAILSRRFEQIMKILSIAVFVALSYGVFMSFSILPVLAMCAICMVSVFVFSPGGKLRKRYFCYFALLCASFISAYYLNLSYSCVYENVSAHERLNNEIHNYAQNFNLALSQTGILPNESFDFDAGKFGGGSFAYFTARYGLIFSLCLVLPSLYLIYAGFNALWKIPVERWISGRARMPLEKRKDFGNSKRRERERLKYESSITPFSRIFCGAASLSFASLCCLSLFFDALSSWCAMIALSVSSALILRFASPRFSFEAGKKKVLCVMVSIACFALTLAIAWKLYAEALFKS